MLYYVDIISSNPREGATKEKRKKKILYGQGPIHTNLNPTELFRVYNTNSKCG